MNASVTIPLPACSKVEPSLLESLSGQIQFAGRGTSIVADAVEIQNPTSAEITILVSLAREAASRGLDFRIVNPSPGLVETLRHLRLDREFGLSAATSP
jgi:anti-anti-sigma regulatory factor